MQSVTDMKPDNQLKKVAFLIACGSVLQIAESMIPNPIPGVRLGLANMLTVVALVDLGFAVALQTAILRTVISSLILGTFLSPTFIMSLSGATISTLAMAGIFRLSQTNWGPRFSLVGVCLVGALTHNLVQILVVYSLFIHHTAVFLLAPWLGLSAMAMGWVTGLVAAEVCRQLQSGTVNALQHNGREIPIRSLSLAFAPGNSLLHWISAEAKIGAIVVFTVGVLLVNSLYAYLYCLLIVLTIALLSKVSLKAFLSALRRIVALLVLSIVIPVFFTSNGRILFSLGPLPITDVGIRMGVTFVSRFALLMMMTFLVVRTTAPESLAKGLGRLLMPLKVVNISGERIATLILLSWQQLPECWRSIYGLIKSRTFRANQWHSFIPDLSYVIVSLYKQAGSERSLLECKEVSAWNDYDYQQRLQALKCG
jgi:heptaprenyl diphosphate synthase